MDVAGVRAGAAAAPMNLFQGLTAIGQWAQQHPALVLGTFGGVPLLAGAVHVRTGGGQRRRDTHGSARWATYREVKRSGLSRTSGVVVGTMREQLFYDNGPTHVFLLAPTRAGKGVFHIQPTLRLGWPGSALVLDPKRGENYEATHAARTQLGRVEAFAPYGRPQTRINVLDTIRLKTLQEHGDALCIAQSLVAPHTLATESATSLHFGNSPPCCSPPRSSMCATPARAPPSRPPGRFSRSSIGPWPPA